MRRGNISCFPIAPQEGLYLPSTDAVVVGNVNGLALFARARECGAMDDDGLLLFKRKVFCSAHAGLIGVSGRKWGPRRTDISCYVLHGRGPSGDRVVELRMERSVGIKQVQTVRSTSEDEPPAPQTHI
jgi:hypothetical protein